MHRHIFWTQLTSVVSSVTCLLCVLLLVLTILYLKASQPPPQTTILGTMEGLDTAGTVITELPEWTTQDGTRVRRFMLKNTAGMSVTVMSWGATITNIVLPDGEDVTLGYDDMAGYLNKGNPYIGAIVGRVANRVGKATFSLNNKTYQLDVNNGENSLHGGNKGFDKYNWEASVDDEGVVFSLFSPDGSGGYPGDLVVSVRYRLTSSSMLLLSMSGMSTLPTPLNMANHAYFNLAGHNSGSAGLYDHVVKIYADNITPVSDSLIPTGELLKVSGTPFDLSLSKRLGDVINKINGDTNNPGFDHNFVINDQKVENGLKVTAEVEHPSSGRRLRVLTNQPGVQFYTGNFIPKEGLAGKKGANYSFHGGFCLETQQFPDFVNKPQFPNGILYPGNVYDHTVGYQFLLA